MTELVQRQIADEALLLRFRDDVDAAALGELFERYSGKVRQIATRFTSHASDAEDIVQGSFLRVMLDANSFDGTHTIESWICGIAIDEARLVRRRSERERATLTDTLEQCTVPEGDGAATSNETRDILERKLAALPEPYRTVMQLRFAQGETTRAIAQIVHRRHETVRKQIYRGIDILRQSLPAGLAGALAFVMAGGLGKCASPMIDTAQSSGDAGNLGSLGRGASQALRPAWIALSIAALLAVPLLWLLLPPPAHAGTSVGSTAESSVPAPHVVGASESAATTAHRTPTSKVGGNASALGKLDVEVHFADGRPADRLPLRVLRDRGEPLPLEQLAQRGTARTTDATGRLHCEGLAPGNYAVVVPGGVPRLVVKITAKETTTRSFPVGYATHVHGRVVDQHGNGLAGASLYASRSSGRNDIGEAIGETNANGDFKVRLACQSPTLWAQLIDGRTSPVEPLTEGKSHEVTLRIGKADRTLRGRVTNKLGAPIRGALVAWLPRDQTPRLPGHFVRTDANGAFAWNRLPATEALLVARVSGYATGCRKMAEIAEGAFVTLQLSTGRTISGTVRDTARHTVAGARLVAVPKRLAYGLGDGGLRTRAALTDGKGHYELTALGEEALSVYVFAKLDGRRSTATRLLAANIRSPQDFIVTPRPRLLGRILSKTGDARPGWLLKAIPMSGELVAFRRLWSVRGRSASDGSFSIVAPRHAPYVVAAFGPADETWPIQLRLTKAEHEIAFRIPDHRSRSRLQGHMDVPKGIDPGLVKLQLQRKGWPFPVEIPVDADGSYSVDEVPAGVYFCTGRHRRLGRQRGTSFEVHGTGVEAIPELKLQRAGGIAVALDPAHQQTVQANIFTLHGEFVARNSQTRGKWLRLRHVAPGTYRLHVWSAGVGTVRKKVVVRSGQTTRVTLRWKPSVPVHLDLEVPVLGSRYTQSGPLQIRITATGERIVFECVRIPTQANRTRIDLGLPAGSYRLQVVSLGGRGVDQEFQVTPGKAVSVTSVLR